MSNDPLPHFPLLIPAPATRTSIAYNRGMSKSRNPSQKAAGKTSAGDYRIDIDVETQFIPDQSDPGANHFVFAYTITIENSGRIPAKLLSRHWRITDADGKVQEVRGDGVVGEQPHLKPGEAFRYTSGAVLETPVGAMEGSYRMEADDGHRFDALIEAFTLARPGFLH